MRNNESRQVNAHVDARRGEIPVSERGIQIHLENAVLRAYASLGIRDLGPSQVGNDESRPANAYVDARSAEIPVSERGIQIHLENAVLCTYAEAGTRDLGPSKVGNSEWGPVAAYVDAFSLPGDLLASVVNDVGFGGCISLASSAKS